MFVKKSSNINSFDGIEASGGLLQLSDCVHVLHCRLGTVGYRKEGVEFNKY